MMDSNDIFNSEVEVELKQYSVYSWKTNVQWKINLEVREYGIKSLSPYCPNQILDLSRSVANHLEGAESDLEDMLDECKNDGTKPEDDDFIVRKRKEIEAIKNIERFEIKSVDCVFEGRSDSDDSSDLSVFPVRIEIDILNHSAKLYFQR